MLFVAGAAVAQTIVPPSAIEFEDAEIFRPTTDPSDYVTVYDSDTLPRGNFFLGIYGDYARNPIEVEFQNSGNLFSRVVKNQGTLQLMGSIGVLDRFELGVRVPGYIQDRADVSLTGNNLEGMTAKLGDVVVNGKISLFQREDLGFGLAVLPEVILPTGNRLDFAGTGKLGGGGLLIADYYPTESLRFSLNGGGYIRDKIGAGPLYDKDDDVNDQIRYGGGVAYDFNERLTGIVEAYGATSTKKPFDDEIKTPADAIGALRFHMEKIDITLGGGAGLTRGQGSPDFRIFLGVTPPKPRRKVKEKPSGIDLSQSRKTYALEDRNGDGRPSPGDVLVYTVSIVNTGTDPVTNLVVDDAIPAHTVYVPGSLAINGRPMSDAPGDDDAEYMAAPVPAIRARAAQLGSVPGENHVDVTFKATIDTEITVPTPIVNQALVAADNTPQFPLPAAQTMVFPTVPQHEHVIVGPEKIELTEEIHFEFNKAVIQPESFPILKELGQVLKEYPDLRIRVEGNTDSVGSEEYNRKLSDRRALAVRDFLVGLGIAKERMQWTGRGETNPIASNDTTAGRAMNRRTEFIVLNPEAVKNAVLQTEKNKGDLAPQSEPAWLKKSKGTPPR
jgi:uncharacterized repeat protein (TIGR01451 family)